VSVAGLGCGGRSRLGQANGASEQQSIAVVRRALELGVTFIDTAAAYGTENLVGKALEGRLDDVVVSTKVLPYTAQGPLSALGLRQSLELSLRRLRRECVDVFHLHGVSLEQYGYCVDELVPELVRLRDDGLLRWLAISEAFARDPSHDMLSRATLDGCWDVVMVGFNMLNPSARDRVLARTITTNVGVLVMFAVRRALSDRGELRRVVAELVRSGHIAPDDVDISDSLGFLADGSGISAVVDAAYRFARHEPGVHVVLTGTGDSEHLERNVASLQRPRLPDDVLDRLRDLFGAIDSVSGN
jgi:L-galactose dehydrogenase